MRGALRWIPVLLLAACGGAPLPAPEVLEIWRGKGDLALAEPMGIAIAPDGTAWVADTGHHRLVAFRGGAPLRSLGAFGEGPGAFRRPMDVDVDDAGRLVVADFGGDRVQVLREDGSVERVLSGEGTGAGRIDGAAGVLAAPSGAVYVADFYGHRVLRFAPSGGGVRVVGRPGRVLPGRLHYPTDLEWLDGRLVVADAYNHRIQLFSPDGEALRRLGGVLGLGVPGDRPGWFRVATGVCTDAHRRLYVADFHNHRVQVFDPEGRLQAILGGPGTGPGRFDRPTDLAVGPDGRIHVVDFGNDRVQVFAPLGS